MGSLNQLIPESCLDFIGCQKKPIAVKTQKKLSLKKWTLSFPLLSPNGRQAPLSKNSHGGINFFKV